MECYMDRMAYPHTKVETIADGAVHVTGLLFAICATVLLTFQAAEGSAGVTATALYCGCMIVAFAASAVYHLSPVDRYRPLLNRIDHAAIYLKIAGTYTPLVAVLGTGFAYAVLGLVWILAMLGAVAKLWFWRTDARGSLALYLGMGWLSVLLIWPLFERLSGSAIALIFAGGVIYSAGTIIFARDAMRFQNAIWHGFVLVASICFFVAISISL